jgi:hypothetical protein
LSDISSSSRAASLAARFDKLLLFRLSQIGRIVTNDAPQLAERTGFADVWFMAGGLSAAGLALAARQPLVHAWVSSMEEMVRNGIHERYPDAHPSRQLKDFARVVLSWASHLPDACGGRIYMAGRRALQLDFGNLVLVGGDQGSNDTLAWRMQDGTLRIERNGACILEGPCRDPDEIRVFDPTWRLLRVPRVAGVSVDHWTPEFHRNRRPPEIMPPIEHELQEAYASLGREARSLVASVCNCATRLCPGMQWIAGLIRYQATGLSASELVELACRDLVERLLMQTSICSALGPPGLIGADLRSRIVDLAAWRMAKRLSGLERTIDDDPEKSRLWHAILLRLRATSGAGEFFRALGEPDFDGMEFPATGGDVLQLPPVGWEGQLESCPPLVLDKTRRTAAFTIDDFAALNAVSELSRATLERILSMPDPETEDPEASAFRRALAAYALGRFDLCAVCLLRCLDLDQDVEEYWHLLAFSIRRLRLLREFDDIMLGGRREIGFRQALRLRLAEGQFA